MAKGKIRNREIKKKFISPFKIYWDKTNWFIFGAGVAILIVGYYLMTFGPFQNPVSLSISPVVLLVAYIIIFPAAILFRKKKDTTDDTSES